MTSAESTFISSTFWTERIGPAAALATLDAMEEEDAPRRVSQIGTFIRNVWSEVSQSVGVAQTATGLPALTAFVLDPWDAGATKVILLRLMLERNFLAGPAVYASIAHTPEVLERYAGALHESLAEIAQRSELVMRNSPKSSTGNFGRLA